MFRLDRLNYHYEVWMSTMKSKNGGELSFSTYNSTRSAVVALLTLFGKGTDYFDGTAATILRGLKTTYANSAGRGLQSVKRGKNPLSLKQPLQSRLQTQYPSRLHAL